MIASLRGSLYVFSALEKSFQEQEDGSCIISAEELEFIKIDIESANTVLKQTAFDVLDEKDLTEDGWLDKTWIDYEEE